MAWDGGATPTPAMAESYYSGIGANFGWYIDDAANSWEAYIFHNNPFSSGVPWVGVIDADTMRVHATNPSNVVSVVQSLATD